MSQQDRYRLSGIRLFISVLLSALFTVLGVLGYRQTGDLLQLLLFLVVALVSWGVVYLLFWGVERVLDSLDDQR